MDRCVQHRADALRFLCGDQAIARQHLPRAANLVHRSLDELLPAEAGIHRHHQEQIEIGDDLAHGRERRRRIYHRAGTAPELSNVIELPLQVRTLEELIAQKVDGIALSAEDRSLRAYSTVGTRGDTDLLLTLADQSLKLLRNDGGNARNGTAGEPIIIRTMSSDQGH